MNKGTSRSHSNGFDSEREEAIRRAKQLFEHIQREGRDLEAGPCISEEILPGWCVDIAHDPRQPEDNLPQNQCQSYRTGRVRHFVELDPKGNVIRAE